MYLSKRASNQGVATLKEWQKRHKIGWETEGDRNPLLGEIRTWKSDKILVGSDGCSFVVERVAD